MSALTSEPTTDRTLVAWFDKNGDPYAVFTRSNRSTVGDCRWVTADLYDGDGVTVWPWVSLVEEMAGLDGPYLLEVVGRG